LWLLSLGPLSQHKTRRRFLTRNGLHQGEGTLHCEQFWRCDPCRDEIPHFLELQNKYRDQGFLIVGVSMDDAPAPVHEFYQRFRMNYPVVMGDANTGELYGGILGLPIAFLIGRDGRI
jgi:peroxiredoxin